MILYNNVSSFFSGVTLYYHIFSFMHTLVKNNCFIVKIGIYSQTRLLLKEYEEVDTGAIVMYLPLILSINKFILGYGF